MNAKVKVTLNFLGQLYKANEYMYSIVKIDGAATVAVFKDGKGQVVGRIGDKLTEAEADWLAQNVTVTTSRHAVAQ